ncbi:TonB-dependent receptor [Sphingobium algorifonticola]|uniref:TonB-dependent receptor n=1 Tax=Sphingobium algorifonticola TaxID=2008318 RepID=A0A437J8L5_9SPHN|nr:TonB-dependent receptor [Sphingobium algorifonticola]RVT41837.1 TonB-dependent receptor [Sphingobium algorifonticola]
MRHSAVALLASAATLSLAPSLAAAQDMAPAAADAAVDAENVGDDIVVYGFGETRQVQTVSDSDIALLTPGTSPLKAIAKLPGVNFQSADAFGAYEWSTRISLRGFNQNQLGFTLDGVPLGDMSYGNHNGLHISRAIISENLGTVTVSQGAGNLATASTSNLGGTLVFASRDPSNDTDIVASGTYGSDDTYRIFTRLDSGDLGGVRGYLSYAYLNAGKWRGDGEQRQHQVNAKVVADVGDGKISAFLNYSDRAENDYQDMSAEMIRRLGNRWDNFAPDWQTAYRVAAVAANQAARAGSATATLPYPTFGLTFPAPVQTLDDAYYDAAGVRRDWLGGVTFETPITDNVRAKLQGYYHNNKGQGLWWTPYVASPTGAPISVRTTEYGIDRMGAIGSITWETDMNRLEIGGWYEGNDFRQARRFYALDNTQAGSSRNSLKFQENPFFTQWDFEFTTETAQYYVMDTLELGQLTLSGGWKGVRVINRSSPRVRATLAAGTIESKDWFLPQVGALYKLGDTAELFANYTQNMRAFVSSATSGPFATTQAGFDALSTTSRLKPETSKTYEIGGRLRAGAFQGSVAAYFVDFNNRLLGITTGAGIVGNPVILQNVGKVRSQGAEVSGTYSIGSGFSATASYAYNDSTYRNNVPGVSAAIRGKTVVDSPKHIASGELAYSGDIVFGRIGANYMSKRYYTYTNDQSVGGRVLVDATIGVKVPEGNGFLTGFAIEASATNLFDNDYVSTIGSNGFGNSGDNQTLLIGAPQQFFVTVRRGF